MKSPSALKISASLCLAAGLSTAAPRAGAQPPPDVEAHIQRGVALFKAGDYAAALAEFQRADPRGDEYGDRAGIRFNIARCLEELGRFEEAAEHFERYLRLPDDEDSHQAARERIANLERTALGTVTVECDADARVTLQGSRPATPCPVVWRRVAAGRRTVSGWSSDGIAASTEVDVPAGGDARARIAFPAELRVEVQAEVSVDGRAPVPGPLTMGPIAPGKHTVEIVVRGAERSWHEVRLAPGKRLVFGGPTRATASSPVDATPPPEPPADAVPAGGHPSATATAAPRSAAGWWVLGAGAVVLAGGAAAGVHVLGLRGDLDDACDGNRCPPSAEDDLDAARTWGWVATGGVGVGLVGVAVGVAMLALDGGGSATIVPRPGGFGLGGTF